MARRSATFTTIRTSGGLLPSDLLARVAETDRQLPGMSPDEYHLAKNEKLREVISRSWNRLVGAWESFDDEARRLVPSDIGTTTTRERWLLVLFQELGYGRLQTTKAFEFDGTTYPVSHLWGNVPIHLVSFRVDLDRRHEGVAGAAKQAPHVMVQEFLNRSDQHLWAFVSNGHALRVLRDNASLTRQAFVEFDLKAMMEGEVYADFVLLWLLCHQSRVEAERPELCWLERWVETAQREGTRALDKLRDGVEAAITTLGTGLLAHPENADLRDALREGDLHPQDFYRQLLRLVYRLLFLFVAEDRDLLLLPEGQCKPDARRRYADFYSTDRLRRLARRRVGTKHDDLWRQLQLVMWSLGSDEGAPALALPPLGGLLWRQAEMSDVVGDPDSPTRLRNQHLLEAVRKLAWVRDDDSKQWRGVDYRNLGSEELGSVYEALLELHPQVSVADRKFELTAGAGNERKTTGSYYTPTSLINQLLDTALDPILDRAESEDDPAAALLGLTICDPACGSGHFLVAAAHRTANRLARYYEVSDDEVKRTRPFEEAMRDVVSHCIYGVDINPMATELAKVSLWLEAHVPGKPLTFLDHHLKTGNSLLGATPALISRGIPDEAFKPIEGDDRSVATSYRKRNRDLRGGQRSLLAAEPGADYEVLGGAAQELDELEDDSVDALHRKEERFEQYRRSESLRRARLLADTWCSAFTAPKVGGDDRMQPFELFYAVRDGEAPATSAAHQTVAEQTAEFQWFHWHLEFPHLFSPMDQPAEDDPTGWTGGFSVMVGNPPWERVKIQEKEWFATREPAIAEAPNKAARSRLIKALYDAPVGSPERQLAEQWDDALREAAATSEFLRSSGRFPLGGVGDVNTYAVFADLFQATVAARGRFGLVCPTGIVTGATYQDFFGYLVTSKRLHSVFTFENEDLLFPTVTNKTKFALVTGTGPSDPSTEIAFTGYVRQASEIRDPARRYVLSAEDVRSINPNTLTAPLFRWAEDAVVTAKIHRNVPVLARESDPNGDPWNVDFLRMFDMANDSGHFVTKKGAEEQGGRLIGTRFHMPDGRRLLPLYEGKMVWHYDHRYGTYEGQTQKQANKGVLPHVTDERHADPEFAVLFRYWVPEKLVEETLDDRWEHDWMLGWRDVGPSERTLVPSFVPTVGAGDKLPLLLPGAEVWQTCMLYAALASLVVDYATRQKTSSAVKQFVMRQVPVPPPVDEHECSPVSDEPLLAFIGRRVVELVVTDRELVPLARDLGYPPHPFRWNSKRRPVLQAELDALLFQLYGLEREDVEWVLDTFTVLAKYEQRDYGEFRTKRLVLERYDEMAKAIETGEPYQTPLDPPPADPSLQVDISP